RAMVAGKGSDLATTLYTPDADGIVLGPPGESFPIRAESQAPDQGNSRQGFDLTTSVYLPEADDAVEAAGQGPAIRADGHTPDPAVVSRKSSDLAATVYLPETDCVVEGATGEASTILAEGHA